MNDNETIDGQSRKSPAGRKPVATEERAREAIEALRREGRTISTAGVKEVIGGSTKTVARILEKLGELPDRIDVISTLPMGLTKAFQQSVQDQTLSVRAECQKQIDSVRELLDQVLFLLLDADKELKSKAADLEALQLRFDALQGEATAANLALERMSAEVETLRERTTAAVAAEAVTAEQLKSALSTAQQLDAELGDERGRHAATRGEVTRSQEMAAAASSQCDEALRDLELAEASWESERRSKAEHTEKLYALLEIVAERDAEFRGVFDEIKRSPAQPSPGGSPAMAGATRTGSRRFLDIPMLRRAQRSVDVDPADDDDTIPF